MNFHDYGSKYFKDYQLRNICCFLLARLLSVFGSQIYIFAMSYYVLMITGSALAFGGCLAFAVVPQIVISPLAGMLADRMSKKKVLVFCDFLSFFVLMGLLLILTHEPIRLAHIYTSVAVLATIDVIYNVAMQSILVDLVNEQRLCKLNFLLQSTSSLGRIAAPIIGGLIWQLIMIDTFIYINAVSFFVSAILIFAVIPLAKEKTAIAANDLRKKALPIGSGVMHAVRSVLGESGILYVLKNKIIFLIICSGVWLNLFFHLGFSITLPYILLKQFNFSAAEFGIIQSCASCGAFSVSLFISFRATRLREKAMFIAIYILAVILLAIGMVSYFQAVLTEYEELSLWIFAIINLCFGVAIVIAGVSMSYLLQVKSDSEYIGRVMGINGAVTGVALLSAYIISGIFLDAIAAYILPILGGIILLGVARIFHCYFSIMDKKAA